MSKYIYAVFLILFASIAVTKPISAISTSSSCENLAYDIRFMVPIHSFSYEPVGDTYLAERLEVTAVKPRYHHLKGVPEPSTLMMLGLGILALMHKILISYN